MCTHIIKSGQTCLARLRPAAESSPWAFLCFGNQNWYQRGKRKTLMKHAEVNGWICPVGGLFRLHLSLMPQICQRSILYLSRTIIMITLIIIVSSSCAHALVTPSNGTPPPPPPPFITQFLPFCQRYLLGVDQLVFLTYCPPQARCACLVKPD